EAETQLSPLTQAFRRVTSYNPRPSAGPPSDSLRWATEHPIASRRSRRAFVSHRNAHEKHQPRHAKLRPLLREPRLLRRLLYDLSGQLTRRAGEVRPERHGGAEASAASRHSQPGAVRTRHAGHQA